jgi:predicted amidohydrolase
MKENEMHQEVNLTLAQISCKVGDKESNIRKMEKIITQAQEKGSNLIIFPELTLTGYVCKDLVYELAESIPNGPSISQIIETAKRQNVHVIFGMIESSTKAAGVLHNTAVLVGPEGLIGKYQKMHLPTHSVFEEKRYFRPGYQIPVFETDIGKIGLIICYDIFFPEITRLMRLKGAQLIACISASPSVRRGFFEVLTVARAIENTMFVTYTNLVGIEDSLQFWGGSRIIAPNGHLLAQAEYDEEEMLTAKINYSDMKQVETFVPMLRDLRPELFNTLKEAAETL